MTAVSLASFALLFLPAAPGLVWSKGKLRRPQWAPLGRAPLFDDSRETAKEGPPVPAPRAATTPPHPRQVNAQGASQRRAPNTTGYSLRTSSYTQLTTYAGVLSEGSQGYRESRTGIKGAGMASPQGKFLPLGALLSRGGRPGSGAWRATQPTKAPGPVTLTTRSHRRRSPPGTGSGNARVPPRLSCSAPAGRTWASPETSSSGGRGARRWPCGAPPAPAPAPRTSASAGPCGDLELATRAGAAAATLTTPARAAPVSRSSWTRLGDWGEPCYGQGRAPGLKAAPTTLSLHPLQSRPTPVCAAGLPLQLQRPQRFQWSPFQSQRTEASCLTLARTAPGTLREPRFYPIWNLPVGGGCWGERTGGAILARREQQLVTRGRNSRELLFLRARRRTQARGGQAANICRVRPTVVGGANA